MSLTYKKAYSIIRHRHVTEKSSVLESLQSADSNPSMRLCDSPKYVFKVALAANKQEIKEAIEYIYADKKIRVTRVNTITIPRNKRRVRGRQGMKSAFKKAIVTLMPGDQIED